MWVVIATGVVSGAFGVVAGALGGSGWEKSRQAVAEFEALDRLRRGRSDAELLAAPLAPLPPDGDELFRLFDPRREVVFPPPLAPARALEILYTHPPAPPALTAIWPRACWPARAEGFR